ncbi:MAG TPA: electron transfer flavoprotein subunit beta/FixA family protein [Ktedonobacteraceae bacterium]|nr:electron transfer flavoprotein subunit beta/FixA family protein [Ktedonobacteraceae bacterium]
MHITVCVKQTPDSSSVYIDPITGQVDYERFVQVLNAADTCAVEAAVRLREQCGGQVTVITLGPPDSEGALRAALAIGADAALRLWNAQCETWGPFTIAAALVACIKSDAMPAPDLILCGDAASDWSSGIVGPALAEQLELPQVTGVTRLETLSQNGQTTTNLRLTRRLERGYRELVEAQLPLLITVTADLNEPRYPSLPAHMAALAATIPVIDPLSLDSTLGQDEADETTILEMHTPRPRPKRIAAPDSHHSAFERIGEIISGGAAGRQTKLVDGSPEELAQKLVEFLRERGFV